MPTDPGHKDAWSSPAGGWPSFCRWCGSILRNGTCRDCDNLLIQEDE